MRLCFCMSNEEVERETLGRKGSGEGGERERGKKEKQTPSNRGGGGERG